MVWRGSMVRTRRWVVVMLKGRIMRRTLIREGGVVIRRRIRIVLFVVVRIIRHFREMVVKWFFSGSHGYPERCERERERGAGTMNGGMVYMECTNNVVSCSTGGLRTCLLLNESGCPRFQV